MAYYIEQAGGAGTGGDDESLEDCWIGLPVTINLSAEAGSTYLHVLLDRAGTETATLADETTATATITPTVTGTLRVRSTAYRADGTTEVWTRVIRTTQDAAGADADNGICPTAFGELAGESNANGNARGYIARHEKNWRAAATISGGGATLSNAAPQDVGTTAAGVSAAASRADHVHAHGNQLGGTLHAVATEIAAGFMSALQAATFTVAGTTAKILADTAIWLRGSTKGGLKITPSADNVACIVDAYNADETTQKAISVRGENIDVTATSDVSITGPSGVIVSSSGACEVHAGTHSRSDASGNFTCSEVPAAARTITYPDTTTSLTDTITQAASGAGGTRTTRGQQGAAGSVGGDLVDGPGDGGTPGTNAPGNRRIKLGTPVSNASGKLVLELEDGTQVLTVQQTAASQVSVLTALSSMIVGLGATFGITITAALIGLRNSLLSLTVPFTKWISSSGYEYYWVAGGVATVSSATTTTLVTVPVQASQGMRIKVTVSAYNITASTHTFFDTSVPWAGRRAGAGALAETINFVANAAAGDADAGFASIDVAVSSNNVLVTATTSDTNQRRIVAHVEVWPANNP